MRSVGDAHGGVLPADQLAVAVELAAPELKPYAQALVSAAAANAEPLSRTEVSSFLFLAYKPLLGRT